MKRKKYKANHYRNEPDIIADESMDDEFAFIAGYTSGGFPYGLRWEDVGIDPELPFEEKEKAYTSRGINPQSAEDEDLPF